jgi:hypothetical protein
VSCEHQEFEKGLELTRPTASEDQTEVMEKKGLVARGERRSRWEDQM